MLVAAFVVSVGRPAVAARGSELAVTLNVESVAVVAISFTARNFPTRPAGSAVPRYSEIKLVPKDKFTLEPATVDQPLVVGIAVQSAGTVSIGADTAVVQ